MLIAELIRRKNKSGLSLRFKGNQKKNHLLFFTPTGHIEKVKREKA